MIAHVRVRERASRAPGERIAIAYRGRAHVDVGQLQQYRGDSDDHTQVQDFGHVLQPL